MGSARLSHSHLKMKSALLLLALAAVSTASPEDIYKKFLRSMDVYNFRMKCWGEKNVVKLSVGIEMAKKKCMQMVEEEDVPRSKRQVEELAEFQETNEEVILQYADFQDDLGTMMGNLSCVLKAVQWLQEDGEVNLEPWTTGLIEPPEGGFEFGVEGEDVERCHGVSRVGRGCSCQGAAQRSHQHGSWACRCLLQVHEQSREASVC